MDRNEYQRRWRQEHREQTRESTRRYNANHPDRVVATQKKYRDTHRARVRQSSSNSYVRHREKRLIEGKAYNKTYNRMHRVDGLAARKRTEQGLRTTILTYYGDGKMVCVRCGFSDIRALSIDHINGNGNKHRQEILGKKETSGFYRWLVRENFPTGFQTLCMNCQFIKRSEQRELNIAYEDRIRNKAQLDLFPPTTESN